MIVKQGELCSKCNKSKVCKYKEDVEAEIKSLLEEKANEVTPLSVQFYCVEFSGLINSVKR